MAMTGSTRPMQVTPQPAEANLTGGLDPREQVRTLRGISPVQDPNMGTGGGSPIESMKPGAMDLASGMSGTPPWMNQAPRVPPGLLGLGGGGPAPMGAGGEMGGVGPMDARMLGNGEVVGRGDPRFGMTGRMGTQAPPPTPMTPGSMQTGGAMPQMSPRRQQLAQILSRFGRGGRSQRY